MLPKVAFKLKAFKWIQILRLDTVGKYLMTPAQNKIIINSVCVQIYSSLNL